MSIERCRLLILGSGPAGYAAAIYAGRSDLRPLLVTGIQPGGQLMITTDVENYPGFIDPILGPDLMERMMKQSERYGVSIRRCGIVRVDFSQRPYQLWGDDQVHYESDSVIIATGAQAKWLKVAGESEYQGYGVSACATCDAFFYRDQPVAVIGGGNTAIEEALHLSKFASHVTLIHRRETLRGEKILQQRLFENPKIEILWNARVTAFKGENKPLKKLTGLEIEDTQTKTTKTLEVDGAFVAIGHAPATEIFKGQLPMDERGYILCSTPGSPATSLPGIFAAGDVMDQQYRQAVTAAGFGCMAALQASHELDQTQQ